MDPNQPQQPQPNSSLDYLNQIAPQAPQKSPFNVGKRKLIFIGAGLVLLVIIVSIILNVIVSAQRQPLQRLAASLTSTQIVVTNAQINLKTTELRSLNSNLKIYLTNTNRDISKPLLAAGVDTTKLPDSITALESSVPIANRLENARLNAKFDRIYAIEMAYQLEKIITLMEQIKASTNSATLKSFVTDAIKNLEPTQKGFADFETVND